MPESQQERGQGQRGGGGGFSGPGTQGKSHSGPPRQEGRRQDSEDFRISEEQIARILRRDGATMVEVARELAERLSDLKSAQLRNFYGSLLKLEARYEAMKPSEVATEFNLLRPKLQYMATRAGGAAKYLRTTFDALLRKAADEISKSSPENFQATARCVFEFAEAVVAYHKERRS